MSMLRILILEDTATDAELVERELRKGSLEFTPKIVATREAFVAGLTTFAPELILADYSLPGFDGIEALVIAKEQCPGVPFVFVSGAIGEELAIETLKQGATDYVLKQRLSRLVPSVRRAMSEAEERRAKMLAYEEIAQLKAQLERENLYLQEEIKTQHEFADFVGNSTAIKKVLTAIETVAPTDANVLILGETGTGKELVARAIHDRSPMRNRALVKVNCAALPSELIESELFGHEKGAFTGAQARRLGRFELANHGTIFLDEIGDLPLQLQAKLLRVLQEGEFERLGGTETIKVNVRAIAATNRDLAEEVRKGGFRPDLFYRLNVFPIEIPPLHKRQSDIPLLVSFFLSSYAKKFGKQFEGVSQGTMQQLMQYSWPGNVRELQNVVERAAIIAAGPRVNIETSLESGPSVGSQAAGPGTLKEIESAHILRVLEDTGWVISGEKGAATVLGLHPNTLQSRMQKLGIKRAKSMA